MVDPLVFNIQNYSLNDGPGIRTIVFLKKNVDFANDPVIKKQSLSMRKGKQRLRKVYVQTVFPVPKYARQWQ